MWDDSKAKTATGNLYSPQKGPQKMLGFVNDAALKKCSGVFLEFVTIRFEPLFCWQTRDLAVMSLW